MAGGVGKKDDAPREMSVLFDFPADLVDRMSGYALRTLANGKLIPISEEDFEKAREERRRVRRLLHEETLFDQLATNAMDWLATMV